MSIREKSNCVVPLTRELAAEFAGMLAIQDRPLSERRIQYYINELAEGRLRAPEWAKATSAESGKTFRVNGQHTSVMFDRMDSLPQISVIMSEYECDTDVDVCTLWSTFDSRSATRSLPDINHVFSAAVPQLANVPMRTITACVSGINFHKSNGMYAAVNKIPYASRSKEIVDHWEFIVFVDGIGLASNADSHIRKCGVIAAMFGTWLVSPEHAGRFWAAVKHETGQDPEGSDRALARWLRSVPAYGTGNKRSVAPREHYFKSIVAWNAWISGEKAQKFHYRPGKSKLPAIAVPK